MTNDKSNIAIPNRPSDGDEIGSLEPGKRADVIVLDVEKPKFVPRTNMSAQIANNAAPADVETVIVDGEVVLDEGTIETMDATGVQTRVESAVDRFESETEWNLGVVGGEPPGPTAVVQDLPKRGPARLLGRLAVQSARDAVSLSNR